MTSIASPAPHAQRTSRNWQTLLNRLTPYLLIAPTLLLVGVFTIWPSLRTLTDSAYAFIPEGRARMLDVPPQAFVGLQNYADLLDSSHYLGGRFLQVMGNTILFTLGTTGVGLPIALVMALLVNRRMRGMALWRFSLFYPVLLPLIGAASIWAFLFSDTVGLINTVLRSFGIEGRDWLGNPDQVLLSVTTVNIWKQTGFFMIFYLAGLQSIPRNIYEAAELDGANTFQQLFYLTLPLLRRTTLFLIVVASTYAFQTVEHLQTLNQGNPADRGNLLLYLIFQNIGSRDALGYINAMTVMLVGFLLIFTLANFFLFEGRNEDND